MSDDGEILHTPADKHLSGLPREKFARTRGVTEARRPALWGEKPVFDGPAPVFGAYPKGFLAWACGAIGCTPGEVLHMCSGMLGPGDGGIRIDLRAAARPTLRADARQLPLRDECVSGVLIDPPYSVEYAADLYGTDYPRPSHLLREASRVVRRGGLIGFLHFIVPFPPPGCSIVGIRGVTTGCGYRIRAFTVYQRDGRPRGRPVTFAKQDLAR